jgi:hypothetical protein
MLIGLAHRLFCVLYRTYREAHLLADWARIHRLLFLFSLYANWASTQTFRISGPVPARIDLFIGLFIGLFILYGSLYGSADFSEFLGQCLRETHADVGSGGKFRL